jgi:hypothetical protein
VAGQLELAQAMWHAYVQHQSLSLDLQPATCNFLGCHGWKVVPRQDDKAATCSLVYTKSTKQSFSPISFFQYYCKNLLQV